MIKVSTNNYVGTLTSGPFVKWTPVDSSAVDASANMINGVIYKNNVNPGTAKLIITGISVSTEKK